MRVSVPNYYDSQQICCTRDMSMSEYYEDALNNHPDKIDVYLQELYNIGCSLWNYNIIQIDHNNNFLIKYEILVIIMIGYLLKIMFSQIAIF